jgi:hypothetical protein
MQLVRTWALVGAMVLVLGGIGFMVVREYRSGVAAHCTETVENNHGVEEAVEVECPPDLPGY